MPEPTSPPEVTVRRAYQIYLYAVCFVAVLVMLFTVAEAAYSIVRIASPTTTAGSSAPEFFGGSGELTYSSGLEDVERKRGTASFVQNVILGALAFGIFSFHWRRAADVRVELERATGAAGGGMPGAGSGASAAPHPPAPVAPPTPAAPPAPPDPPAAPGAPAPPAPKRRPRRPKADG